MKRISLIVMLGIMLLLTACGAKDSQSAEPAAIVEAPVEVPVEQPIEAPVDAPVDQPMEPSQDDGQPPSQASGGGMIEYSAPEDLFKLRVPSGWNMQEDTQTIENTTVQTFTAPDGNAFVQVLANRVNDSLDHVLKGQVTLDYMKRLYGEDLRVATDVLIDDGREKLEWWSDENKTNGITYFDMGDDYLYFYTVAYKEKFENDYLSMLEEVADSFSR